MPIPRFLDLQSLDGEILSGASMSDAPTLEAIGRRTRKPHCAVYSWIVIDVLNAGCLPRAGDEDSRVRRYDDALPSDFSTSSSLMLYSHYVEFHSANRFQKGDSVRSGYAIAFDRRGIFETEDTIYVLMGKGYLRSATVEEVDSIPAGIVDELDLENRPVKQRTGIRRWNDEDMAFCDIAMTHAQSTAFVDLVRQLRVSEKHPELETVFLDIEQELS
ncbi:hypothetical protein LZ023_14470 [Pseudomonas silvicola]|nr:hypothetical protein LZ023_14470 [Pseudomonas silvicola]